MACVHLITLTVYNNFALKVLMDFNYNHSQMFVIGIINQNKPSQKQPMNFKHTLTILANWISYHKWLNYKKITFSEIINNIILNIHFHILNRINKKSRYNSKIKDNLLSIYHPFNLMMLFKDLNKTLKSKSLNKWNKFKILCLNKLKSIKN